MSASSSQKFSRKYLPSIMTVLALGLSGCTSLQLISEMSKSKENVIISDTDVDYGARYKIGLPYVIKGQTYNPKINYGYREVGLASWYGEAFHGKQTANGAIFNMHSVTAAHRTLPLPSIIEVKNLANGRKLIVTVNDRGPFHGNRILDLSMRAAELLGFKKKGVTRVDIRILEKESRQLASLMKQGIKPKGKIQANPSSDVLITRVEDGETAPIVKVETKPLQSLQTTTNQPSSIENAPPISGVYVQIAAFNKFESAELFQSRVEEYPAAIGRTKNNGVNFYKVMVGPFPNVTEANSVKQILLEDFRGAHVITWHS